MIGFRAPHLRGRSISRRAPRAARQPPCPFSRAAASLCAPAEPRALPKVPRLLTRPRGFQAPWESPSRRAPGVYISIDLFINLSIYKHLYKSRPGRPISPFQATGFCPVREGCRVTRLRVRPRCRPSMRAIPARGGRARDQRCFPLRWASFPACALSGLVELPRAVVPPRRRDPSIFRRCGEHGVVSVSGPCPSRTSARHRVEQAFPCRIGRLTSSASSRTRPFASCPPTLPSQLPRSMQARMFASTAQGPRKPFRYGFACAKSSSPHGFRFPPCPAFARMRRACHEAPERGA